MTDLVERYGAPSTRSRWTVGGIGAALLLVVVAVTLWSYVDQADPEVRSALVRYDVVSANEATGDLTVVRSSPDVPATCDLQALAADHSVVGEVTERVESGPASQTVRITLRTEREAVTVVSQGCLAPGQRRRG